MAIEYIGTDAAAYAATYRTNEDGSPVPFVSLWRLDVPSQPVPVYEDATGALLGSGVSNASPEASGPHAGWYLCSVPITSWSSSAGALLPTFTGEGVFAAPSLTATPALPSFAGVGALTDFPYTTADELTVPTLAGAGGLVAPTFSAERSLPSFTGAGSLATPTIEAGGGGGGLPFSDNFDRADGAIGNGWLSLGTLNAMVLSGGAAKGGTTGQPGCGALRPETFPNNQYVQAKITAALFDEVYLVARGSSAGAGGTENSYVVGVMTYIDEEEFTNWQINIYRIVSGTATNIGSAQTGVHTHLRAETSGTTLTVKSSDNGTTWTTVTSVTDSAIASGAAGIRAYGGSALTATIDDFSAGAL